MNRNEFEALRSLPGKYLDGDVVFSRPKNCHGPFSLNEMRLHNTLNEPIKLTGHYDPRVPKFTFNFVREGTGPICRLDVNGTVHKDVGRNHKHELRKESDPAANLPTAYKRDDLASLSMEDAWRQLCKEANIVHNGNIRIG